MNISHALSPLLAVISGGLLSGTALSDNIVLPPPDKKGGRPLMQVLNERHSTRSFADKPIPMEILSSLLWAAQGVNRDDPDYRTAPSSQNSNEIEIYAVLPQAGPYLWTFLCRQGGGSSPEPNQQRARNTSRGKNRPPQDIFTKTV